MAIALKDVPNVKRMISSDLIINMILKVHHLNFHFKFIHLDPSVSRKEQSSFKVVPPRYCM